LGVVVGYRNLEPGYENSHERASCNEIARRLAALKGFEFAGDHDPSARYGGPLYFVPRGTLVDLEVANELGIASEDDFFGGAVPSPFVATKAITHPLLGDDAIGPTGWSREFPDRVRDAVLDGYSAFTAADALAAGKRLLSRGRVRLKAGNGVGGRGQLVVRSRCELETALGDIGEAELSRDGLVLEENLDGAVTYSVGQVRVAGLIASYCGTQRLTSDNSGAEVYGGSDLFVARGGFDALLAFELAGHAGAAIAQARLYDCAAGECFSGFFASRRNYDVAHGTGFGGRARCGVLEQSWRMGGASGAEIAALEAFCAEPRLKAVSARTVEIYGGRAEPPPGAMVYFHGVDDKVGAILKYTLLSAHDDA
jgi:Protein of unknown function (DUF3182)